MSNWGIFVCTSDIKLQESVRQFQSRLPNIFVADFGTGFEEDFLKHKGAIHIVTVSCEPHFDPQAHICFMRKSGFEGEIVGLVCSRHKDYLSYEPDVSRFWHSDMFRSFVACELR